MATDVFPQFGRVLTERGSERRVWYFVLPGVLAVAALVAAGGVAISRTAGLATQARLAQQQAAEAQKGVEERDRLLQRARADESILRSAGQGAAVLAAARPDVAASGVAMVHPEHHALKVYAFGLVAAPAGKEYRVEALLADGRRAPVGVLAPDAKGAAFLLAKDLPEGVAEVAVTLAPSGAASEEGRPLLAGTLPKPGESGVVTAAPAVQARTPPAARRGR